MDGRDEVAELTALLRSRFPIILIESHEEPRMLELLSKACNLENQVLMSWSITKGLGRHGREDTIYQTNELLDVLKHIDKTAQNGVYVLCDAHPGLKTRWRSGSSARSRCRTTARPGLSCSSVRDSRSCRPRCCGCRPTSIRSCRIATRSAPS
jgi:hypothetical protein